MCFGIGPCPSRSWPSELSEYWNYLLDAVRRPREQLTRGQHQVRYAWDLAVHCGRQLNRHRAEGMAAELTYRTIFSLIPVVVLGLVMFRVFGGLEDVQNRVENQLYSFFGVPEIPEDYIQRPVGDTDPDIGDQESDRNKVDNQEAADQETVDATLLPGEELVDVDPTDDPIDPAATVADDVQLPPKTDLIDGDSAANGDVDESDSEKALGEKDDPDDPPVAQSDDEARPKSGDGARITDSTDRVVTESDLTNDSTADNESVDGKADPADETAERETALRTRASIRKTLHEVTSKIATVDFASVGVFGLLLFVYAAIALADSVEHLFNRIYDAPSKRPIHIRVAIHWSIITLGSGLLAMSLYLSGQLIAWVGNVDWVGGSAGLAAVVLNHLLSMLASWVLMFLLYALMPNTHVSVRAAAAGAAVSALMWEAAKFGFRVYVAKAVPYSALYGSLGLIPLFLFWIYVTWLIVLFGLILTYTLQMLNGRPLSRDDRERDELPAGDPDWMLPIMTEVAAAFQDGRVVGRQELADRLGLSSRVVREMEQWLVEGGMLRHVSGGAGEDMALTLAKPAEKIPIAQILDLAHEHRPTSNHPAWKTLANLKRAERTAAGDKKLVDLLTFSLKS
ncbi:ribonuclease BN/unknown domain fusion protein [Crateriforma conspicua]|uniref:Uncharacterized protein n=1 Tax=Crateriforma conspicua TaxID=2527996 RepID=A0A5C6FW45_9PLAN|nr:ribonuclease BN/unknown domain fusion protein [Crateriforma conspicua]